MDKEIKEYTKQELGISAMSIGQLKRIKSISKSVINLDFITGIVSNII